MLGGLLCSARRLFTPLSFSLGGGASSSHHHHHHRRSHHYHSAYLRHGGGGGAALTWNNSVLPTLKNHFQIEEGSRNVACDARPARWLHRADSAWLLFGARACLAAPPPLDFFDFSTATAIDQSVSDDENEGTCLENVSDDDYDEANLKNSAKYRVKGVLADGRCLFRAIAHMACLRNGEEAPDEKLQTELADKLRAQVVDELLMRRKETEWFIEGDFDAYVERLKKPYVWGGEPELLMASHVLKTMISVYMLDRSSGNLINIVNYGEEYQKDGESPIKVLFHGYGHYDILEIESEQSSQKAEA